MSKRYVVDEGRVNLADNELPTEARG
jgi:hypothetical protein